MPGNVCKHSHEKFCLIIAIVGELVPGEDDDDDDNNQKAMTMAFFELKKNLALAPIEWFITIDL